MNLTKLVTCAFTAALLAGCTGRFAESHQNVADVTKPETIVLRKQPKQGHIHYLTIQGSGEVTGDAEISLMLNGTAYKTEKLSGPFEFQWQNDWYDDTAELRYTPASVTGGKVLLACKFKES